MLTLVTFSSTRFTYAMGSNPVRCLGVIVDQEDVFCDSQDASVGQHYSIFRTFCHQRIPSMDDKHIATAFSNALTILYIQYGCISKQYLLTIVVVYDKNELQGTFQLFQSKLNNTRNGNVSRPVYIFDWTHKNKVQRLLEMMMSYIYEPSHNNVLIVYFFTFNVLSHITYTVINNGYCIVHMHFIQLYIHN